MRTSPRASFTSLIAKLRSGELTGGRPVAHFVLLVQELYRSGDDVPAFDVRDRSAFAIKPSNPDTLDVDDHAATLGLSMLYVPSMRNGPELREDRGNAIISTEPLLDPFALELPLARQRRVALGAAITVQTAEGPQRLEVVDAHLEPLSSPKTLWVFKNPRAKQVQAILDLLATPRFTDPSVAGIVLGGDFNTVRSGARETAYRLARAWSDGPGQRGSPRHPPDGTPRLPVLQGWETAGRRRRAGSTSASGRTTTPCSARFRRGSH